MSGELCRAYKNKLMVEKEKKHAASWTMLHVSNTPPLRPLIVIRPQRHYENAIGVVMHEVI